MQSPPTIAILGTGLIGGSLGLALRSRSAGYRIVGYDEPETLDLALRRGAIDEAAGSPEEAVEGARVVVLATPIGAMASMLTRIAPLLAPGTIVTDTGSVKHPVAAYAAEVLPDGVHFIGGHPMAGSELRGIAHADGLLFENAVYVLCPPNPDEWEAGAPGYELTAIMEATGARVLVLDAPYHDEAAAAVSHLPQLLAIALVNQTGTADPGVLRLAAGGFRDMTRIASSSFSVWRDILLGNDNAILDAMSRFAREFERLRNRLASGDIDALRDAFHQAGDLRAAVPERSKGFLNPLSDVFVYTRDEPGALVRITSALFDEDVNIKDIELLKIREGTGGTFRLGFSGDTDAARSVEVLAEAGFQAYML